MTGQKYRAQQPWAATSESILVWDEAFHDLMLGDHLRMSTYRKAIFEVVEPGDRVIDLGVGSGILSQWALEAGAAQVIGIEMSDHMMARAIDQLRAANLLDRFVPVSDFSFNVKIAEPADVLISEIIGNMADNENFQPILHDAIERLLKPGGKRIPLRVRSYITPVRADEAHRALVHRKIPSLSPAYDIEKILAGRRTESVFDLYYDCILPEDLYLAPPVLVMSYEGAWDQAPCYTKCIAFTLSAAGVLTGFKMHFEADLSEATFLNISGGDIEGGTTSDSWKHAYLPIRDPIECLFGDTLELTFSRRYPAEPRSAFSQSYSWAGEARRHGEVVGVFSQCTA
jgi:protein arginine N-methyltransferase 1